MGNLQIIGDGFRNLKDHLVEERHAQLQRVSHIDLVGLDQNIAPHPRKQVQVLHASHRIHVGGLGIDRGGDLAVIPFAGSPRNDPLHLLEIERAGIAVIAFLHGHGSAFQQRLPLHTVRQHFGQVVHAFPQRGGHIFERLERQRFLVDRVAAEQLVRALAGEHHLDVLAGLLGHEIEGHERRVRHGVVKVPHDLRNRIDVFLRRHDLHDVLHADCLGRLGGNIHLGVALAFETGGEREQVRVMTLRQRSDGGRVDAARKERSDGHIGPHMLFDAVFQSSGNAVE